MVAVLSWSVLALLVALVAGLGLWRQFDFLADRRIAAQLAATQSRQIERFDCAMVVGLPDAARRYFRFAIAPGTPLHSVTAIEMTGRFNLGTREHPNWLSMMAHQTLAGPRGLVWRMSARRSWLHMSGSDALADGVNWTRFWLGGIVPVARVSGSSTIAGRLSAGPLRKPFSGRPPRFCPALASPGRNSIQARCA